MTKHQDLQDLSPYQDDGSASNGDDQGHDDGKGEDLNINDYQETSMETIEEANTCRENKTTRHLRPKAHTLEDVLGDVRGKISTRKNWKNLVRSMPTSQWWNLKKSMKL
jgi:hypothetical protein